MNIRDWFTKPFRDIANSQSDILRLEEIITNLEDRITDTADATAIQETAFDSLDEKSVDLAINIEKLGSAHDDLEEALTEHLQTHNALKANICKN